MIALVMVASAQAAFYPTYEVKDFLQTATAYTAYSTSHRPRHSDYGP